MNIKGIFKSKNIGNQQPKMETEEKPQQSYEKDKYSDSGLDAIASYSKANISKRTIIQGKIFSTNILNKVSTVDNRLPDRN